MLCIHYRISDPTKLYQQFMVCSSMLALTYHSTSWLHEIIASFSLLDNNYECLYIYCLNEIMFVLLSKKYHNYMCLCLTPSLDHSSLLSLCLTLSLPHSLSASLPLSLSLCLPPFLSPSSYLPLPLSRSTITLFKPRTGPATDFRVWNSQLIKYAGYKQSDGSIMGDPDMLEFTEVCII